MPPLKLYKLMVQKRVGKPGLVTVLEGKCLSSCLILLYGEISNRVTSLFSYPMTYLTRGSLSLILDWWWSWPSIDESVLKGILSSPSQGIRKQWLRESASTLQNHILYDCTVLAPRFTGARYQFSSVTQSCLTLWDPMNCSTPGLHVHHQLLDFTQTHVHRVGDATQPSHPLSSPPSAPNPSQHQSLFQWVNSLHEVAKVLEFQLQYQSFQWIFSLVANKLQLVLWEKLALQVTEAVMPAMELGRS